MSRTLSLIFSVALVVVAAFPTSPLAATASVFTNNNPHGLQGRQLTYAADAGETNQVEASVTEDQAVTIHDSGAVITAEAGCLSVDAHTVECPSIVYTFLVLGDLDEAVSVPESFALFGVGFAVYGGPGSDTLSSCAACSGLLDGGLGNDALSGGDRNDYLFGGPGNDTITAGGGSDNIRPGSGDDAVDAGAGNHDLLDYFYEPGPMTVNLRTGVATGAGTDTFIGVESVRGSRHGDLLIGDEHANTFDGFQGPDIIRGGRGADAIGGGPGSDILVGGPGDDVLSGWGEDDLLFGGLGGDRLFDGSGNDVLKGEQGNDLLVGDFGSDILFAGAGDDLLRSRDGRADIVRGQQGQDRARVDEGLDSVRGVEKLL